MRRGACSRNWPISRLKTVGGTTCPFSFAAIRDIVRATNWFAWLAFIRLTCGRVSAVILTEALPPLPCWIERILTVQVHPAEADLSHLRAGNQRTYFDPYPIYRALRNRSPIWESPWGDFYVSTFAAVADA